VSLKAPLIIFWACLLAGAAVASENYRMCDLEAQAESKRLHEYLQLHEDDALNISEFDVTS
jgi:hypothetical protein